LVGSRFGPVLRTEPYDNAAQSMDWPDAIRRREGQRAEDPPRTARFRRDRPRPAAPPREHSLRD
jgi:hypothetical protein